MSVWKKLNPDTGEYEKVDGTETDGGGLPLGDTVGVPDAYTTYRAMDIATSVSSKDKSVIYHIEEILTGDIIKLRRNNNSEKQNIVDGEGNNLDAQIQWSNPDSIYNDGLFVADKNYQVLLIKCSNKVPDFASVTKRTRDKLKCPVFNGHFIPTIVDESTSTLHTLSSRKIRELYGKDEVKARKYLSGGVWIALGDSYTVGAKSNFAELAQKYGMIIDNQGKVSSTICGDLAGNRGFSPFWHRMDGFIDSYTSEAGQIIDGVPYKAADVKLVTFMGGANDGNGLETWIGKKTSMDTNLISGACNYIFSKLRSTFPNAEIICILQPANWNDAMNYSDDKTAQVLGFKDLQELKKWDVYSYGQYKQGVKESAVRDCAEQFGITVVDCMFDWYSVCNPTHRARYWRSDKLHLSFTGYAELTAKLERDGILKLFG